MHALFLIRLGRIEWRIRPLRILRDATFVSQDRIIIGAIPIAAPFPDIPRHVVNTVTVWRKRFHWCDSSIAILARIFNWKFSLPSIRHPFSARAKLIAPYIDFSRQTAACREFKLGFGRQTFARPVCVSFRIRISDVYDGIISLALQVGVRSSWMAPVSAFHIAPPLVMIVQRNFLIGGRENDRASNEIFCRRGGKFFLRWRAFRDRDVTGCLNEFLELYISYRRCIHPETIHSNPMNRPGIVRCHWHFSTALSAHASAHGKFTAGNPYHSLRRFARRRILVRNRRRERRRLRRFRVNHGGANT